MSSVTPTATSAIPPGAPLQLGSPEEFAALRDFFRRARFDDVTLCRLLGMEDMSDFGSVQWEKLGLPAGIGCPISEPLGKEKTPIPAAPAEPKLDGPLRWCVQVLARGLPCPATEARAVCGEEALAAFHALGLLRPAKKHPEMLVCPVWVYPADGFVVASDRRDDPDGEPFTPAEDVVFPAIYAGTLRFLRLLPEARGGEALDLCGGCGIGAFRLSRTARSAVTADLTPRSAFFAEFNARLNGVAVSSLCGDLYQPLLGRQFDLISAHPPFVPAAGPNMAYRDAGATGEDVTRRIIEGLPAHLRPGGICVVLCVARDTTDQPFEQRARDWLGAANDQFDVLFGLEKIIPVEGVVDSLRKQGQRIGEEGAHELLSRLRALGTRQFVYGALFIKRCLKPVTAPGAPASAGFDAAQFQGHQEARPTHGPAEAGAPCATAGPVPPPARVRLSPAGRAADFERLLAWRALCRRPGFGEWLAGSRPRLAPQLELTARHLVREGELVPAEFVFSIAGGFEAALRPDAWVVPLVARLEGKRSVAEVFGQAREVGELPAGFTFEAFAGLIQMMIERGFLEVEVP